VVNRSLGASIHELLVTGKLLIEGEDGSLAFLARESVSHATSATNVLVGWWRRRHGTTGCRASGFVTDSKILDLVASVVSSTSSSRAKVCCASASRSRRVRLVNEVAQ
jgi:hypothetical protein